MNEQDMQDLLTALISDYELNMKMFPELQDIESTRTFEEAGVLTMNKGLVLRMNDRSEFYITIAQRRGA